MRDYTRTLELVKYRFTERIAEMAFVSPDNTKLESYIDMATRNLCMKLEHFVYSGATEAKVVSAPATWKDLLKIAAKKKLETRLARAVRYREAFTVWLIGRILLWLAKRPPEYLEITFHARELFPDIPVMGPKAVVVAGAPEFRSTVLGKSETPPFPFTVRTEPASVVCKRCGSMLPLKDALRPKDAYEQASLAESYNRKYW